jgi:hypothetical protein
MVNTLAPRLVAYAPRPDPIPAGDAWRTLNGPLYDLSEIKRLAVPGNIVAINEDCELDIALLKWEVDDTARLIGCLETRHYDNSLWCVTSVNMWVDCDAYVIKFDARAFVESPTGTDLYVKFGCRPNLSVVLLLSCHPSVYI